jgi:hypothetical protein
MPGAASISAMPMTSYTTMPAMPMAYSTWNARSVRICWKTFKLPKGALMFAGLWKYVMLRNNWSQFPSFDWLCGYKHSDFLMVKSVYLFRFVCRISCWRIFIFQPPTSHGFPRLPVVNSWPWPNPPFWVGDFGSQWNDWSKDVHILVGLVLIMSGINDNNHTIIYNSSSNTSNIIVIVMRMSEHPHNYHWWLLISMTDYTWVPPR